MTGRSMWIPRPFYELLPYLYMAAGVALLAVAFLSGFAPSGLLMVVGGLLLTAGLVLWMRRRDYRATQEHYDPSALDD